MLAGLGRITTLSVSTLKSAVCLVITPVSSRLQSTDSIVFRFIIHRCERNLYQRKHVSTSYPVTTSEDRHNNNPALPSWAAWRPGPSPPAPWWRASARCPYRRCRWWGRGRGRATSPTGRSPPSPGWSTAAPGCRCKLLIEAWSQ